jgi:predicted MPP superfamily phosphohydrolase
MSLVTRRGLLRSAVATTGIGGAAAAYAIGVEPNRLVVQRWNVTTTAPWPPGLRLRIAVLSDIHASEPFMSVDRIRSIVSRVGGLGADVVVMLGDFVAGSRIVTRYVPSVEWADALRGLTAPLGVWAVLGNHDWWEDKTAQRTGEAPIARRALEDVGIRVLQNEAVRLRTSPAPVWLAGLGDQLAFLPARKRDRSRRLGIDDLGATLAAIPAGAPAILLAHEPDIFPQVPASVALTLSGHTHGGQVRLLGWSPVVPSRFRNHYAWGHVREHTDLVVSGGLGYSIMPIRFGVPPEITFVEVGPAA